MKKLFLITAAIALLCLGGIAQAAPIQGGALWNIFLGSITGTFPTFTMPQPPAPLTGIYVKPGTGDFSIVPAWPAVPWLSSTTLDVTSPAGWTLGSATFGTWVTTGGTYTTGPGFLNCNLQGTFTPGTMFSPTLTANTGTMTIGFNMNGNTATNVNGTFNMDPVVPEPSSLALLASGLLGLGAFYRRRR